MRPLVCICVALVTQGCGPASSLDDDGLSALLPIDASVPDSGLPDSGALDGGSADSGIPHQPIDAGIDAGLPSIDAGVHSIGVRQRSTGVWEFYSRDTGLPFTIRGNNYIRLANVSGAGTYHSNFDVGFYNRAQTAAAFGKMASDGYNTVRVFISDRAVGSADGGLSGPYLDNVADALQVAKAERIVVIVTLPFVPARGGYYGPPEQPTDAVQGENWFYLTDAGIDAKARYARDFVRGLRARAAPLDAILSYNIENEAYFVEDRPPLTTTSGTLVAPNGKTYALNTSKRLLMEDGLVHWINTVRRAILAEDPTALVAPGFFNPSAVAGADNRVVYTRLVASAPDAGGSDADYVDFHAYPGRGLTFPQIVNDFQIPPINSKMHVLGEMGAFRGDFGDINGAAVALRQWQISSCAAGFVGWLAWTWDTVEQPELFNVLESSGSINGQLAPVARPDPCR